MNTNEREYRQNRGKGLKVGRRLPWALAATLLLAAILGAQQESTYGTRDDLLPGGAGMAIRDGILFTTAGSEPFAKARRLVAVDIAGDVPRVISSIDLQGFPQDLALNNKVAWVVDGLHLVAVDTTDPAAMRIVSQTALAEAPESGPQGIVIDGTTARLACRRRGVVSVDISNPAAPVVGGTVATPFSRGLARGEAGGKAWLVSADDTRGLHVIGDGKIATALPLKHGSAARVRVAGGKVFVANGGSFLSVFTLGGDGGLAPYAAFTEPPDGPYYGSYAYDVLPAGDQAVLAAGESGILVIDLSEAARPACAAMLKLPGGHLTRGVIREGERLFVNSGTMGGQTLLFTLEAGEWPSLRIAGEALNISE